ncbi:glutamine amidotransferase [compost metagenome]|uniref:glutamine amidotransferase-related protein n=1 Tax=Sphingobacterium sp. GVS05A TaxID=2862679 RepID=UPI000FA3A95C|nr:gamma-glutamyl-gamma-aminobutyrate hydrolase family protein [Sphingobacterium sp. GVS05A]
MNVHFIQHEDFEAPGAYLQWALARHHTTSFSKVYQYEALPQDGTMIDLLVIMGGPQSPDSSQQEYPYYDAQAEIALIRQCIHAGKAVVGVCLGSQLIGEALGATYEPSPEKEIGVFGIQLTQDGLADQKVRHFGEFLPVGHWHNDMPGLSPASQVLAVSAGCPRQIVRYTELVYGFQCHMELNSEVVELLIQAEKDLLRKSKLHRFVQTPDQIRSYDYTEMNNKLFQFLDHLEAAYQHTKNNF